MIKLTTIDEAIDDNGLKVMVHSPSGFGKTVLCLTAVPRMPNRRALLISAESGLLSLKAAPADVKENVDVAAIDSLEQLGELYSMLSKNAHPYDWIMLDSVSEIAEVCLSAHKAKAKDPRQAYGSMADDMFALLRGFRDLPKVCIYMSAKQGYAEDSAGVSRYRPLMPGKQLTQGIAYLFDEVYALRIVPGTDEGSEVRALQTTSDIQYECKDRSGVLAPLEHASLAKIAAKIGVDYDALATARNKVIEATREPTPEEIAAELRGAAPDVNPDDPVTVAENLGAPETPVSIAKGENPETWGEAGTAATNETEATLNQ